MCSSWLVRVRQALAYGQYMLCRLLCCWAGGQQVASYPMLLQKVCLIETLNSYRDGQQRRKRGQRDGHANCGYLVLDGAML